MKLRLHGELLVAENFAECRHNAVGANRHGYLEAQRSLACLHAGAGVGVGGGEFVAEEAFDFLVDVAEVRSGRFLVRLEFKRACKHTTVAEGFLQLHGFLFAALTRNNHCSRVAFVGNIEVGILHPHK